MELLKNINNYNDEIMVSIVCNTFNHSKSIRNTLESFLNQKVNFGVEVLIHDDCSTDGTISIIKEYQNRYPKIIKPIFESVNQYSKGVDILAIQSRRVKGKYVAICEGDDYWSDDFKLSKQLDCLERSHNKICLHKVLKFDVSTNEQRGFLPNYNLDSGTIEQHDFVKIITNEYSFQTSSYFLDAAEFKKMYSCNLKFVRLFPTGDEPLLLYFSSISKVDYIDEIMSVYTCMNEGSWSNKYSKLSNKEIGMHKKRCYAAYKEFERFSNKRFHDSISKRIHDTKWAYLFLCKRYVSLFFYDPKGILAILRKKFKKT